MVGNASVIFKDFLFRKEEASYVWDWPDQWISLETLRIYFHRESWMSVLKTWLIWSFPFILDLTTNLRTLKRSICVVLTIHPTKYDDVLNKPKSSHFSLHSKETKQVNLFEDVERAQNVNYRKCYERNPNAITVVIHKSYLSWHGAVGQNKGIVHVGSLAKSISEVSHVKENRSVFSASKNDNSDVFVIVSLTMCRVQTPNHLWKLLLLSLRCLLKRILMDNSGLLKQDRWNSPFTVFANHSRP